MRNTFKAYLILAKSIIELLKTSRVWIYYTLASRIIYWTQVRNILSSWKAVRIGVYRRLADVADSIFGPVGCVKKENYSHWIEE
jgi:hypothetical protein